MSSNTAELSSPAPAPKPGLRAWPALSRAGWIATGLALALLFWLLTVDILALPRFRNLPRLGEVLKEWTSPNPVYGLSLYTPIYYQHIAYSLARVLAAFSLATVLGVPLGLAMGWSRRVYDYVFPLFEVLRPIPPLAWVPLAILMFRGTETPIVFLTFLASFYATALNTMLGVRSIDPSLIRAAKCLGARPSTMFWRVVLPGTLPAIFGGLQISLGVAWFSLVAAEMVSGQYGLGYIINTGYAMATYPTIFIGIITLGLVGFATSLIVRSVERALTGWRSSMMTGSDRS
jgi:NitT/TauT family transport system permease protein